MKGIINDFGSQLQEKGDVAWPLGIPTQTGSLSKINTTRNATNREELATNRKLQWMIMKATLKSDGAEGDADSDFNVQDELVLGTGPPETTDEKKMEQRPEPLRFTFGQPPLRPTLTLRLSTTDSSTRSR